MTLPLLALVLAAGPASKLGPAIAASPYDQGAAALLDHCPAVASYLAPMPSLSNAIVALRQACPKTQIAVRASVSAKFDSTSDPSAAAQSFWLTMQGSLGGVAPATIDWLEGPHGFDNVPDWSKDAAAAAWVASFWSRLADLMNEAQFHPLVGSIPSGAPALDGQLAAGSTNLFKPIADEMKKKTYRWGWSYQAYTASLIRETALQAASALRYRAIHDQCALGDTPLVLTEAGQGPSSGWGALGTSSANYLAWLQWFDGELQLDSYVVGAALFQFGDRGTYASFNLGDLAADLGRWLQDPSFPDAGNPARDGGSGGGGDGGGNGGSGNSGLPSVPGYELPARGCGCSSAGALAAPAAALAALVLRRRRS